MITKNPMQLKAYNKKKAAVPKGMAVLLFPMRKGWWSPGGESLPCVKGGGE